MNEANLTFEICYKLRNSSIPFELELSLPVGRVDIAIINGNFLHGIIECKKEKKTYDTNQFKRYKSMGVPFHHSFYGDDIETLVRKCKTWLMDSGRTLDDIRKCPNVIRRSKRIKPIILTEYDCDLNLK